MGLIRTFGFDPGLRHGVLLSASWDFSTEPVTIAHYSVIRQWKKPRRKDKGQEGVDWLAEDSVFRNIYQFSNGIVEALIQSPDYYHHPIAVDYTPYSIYWQSRRMQGVTLAFFLGYLTRAFHTLGHPVIFLSPAIVRESSKLPKNAEKADVWKELTTNTISGFHGGDLPTDEDVRDALILSFLLAARNIPLKETYQWT